MSTVFRVFSYLRRYPLLGSLQIACAIFMTVLGIVFPHVIKVVTGEIIPLRQFDRLLPYTLMAAGAFLATNLFNSLRIILNNTFEQKVIFDIRSDLYRKIQRLPMRWFDEKRTGDIMTRVTEDVTSMERVLIDGIEQGLIASLQILVVGGYLVWLNPALAGVAFIPVPLLALGAMVYTRHSPKRHRVVRQATSEMNALLHDNIDGIAQVKAYTREAAEHGRFNSASDAVRRATLRVMRLWAVYNPSMEFLRNVGYVLMVGIGGGWLMQGRLDQGVFLAFLFALSLFYEPVGRLHQLNQIVQAGRAAGERVFEIIDAEEEPDLDVGAPLPLPVKGHVVFENVGFSYTGRASTLRGVRLEALPGEMVALVGHTGAGKSTIINLLARFYEYDEGRITLDGVEIKDLRKSELRDTMGYVTQESFLFNGTVRENLLMAKEKATEEELWHALEAANARDFVERLPEQLDTNVGERGVKLSVGEKQRIAIARVVLKSPPILLLDEATASVDTQTEKLIQSALDRIMTHRTSFVIAHRLSTVRNADRIYVLGHGKVLEHGHHEALLARDGHYAKLCRTSLIAEEEETDDSLQSVVDA